VDRLACVDVPALPLQLLLKRNPEFQGHPSVVVDEDKPLGLVQWSNEAARRLGVLPGMRFSAALSLVADLRAGVVDDDAIGVGVKRITERLQGFSPDVEPSADDPGVFWLNASGLNPLYPTLLAWAERLRTDLACAGFFATAVVGFSRFGTWAVAKARPGHGVFRTPAEERRMAEQVKLARLDLEPRARDALDKLGVRTVGQLLKLPAGGLRKRFGPAVHRVHRLGTGELKEPLSPARDAGPVKSWLSFDFPVSDTARLLFFAKSKLDGMLRELSERNEALVGLRLRLKLERDIQGQHALLEEDVRPASPTLDARQILNLLHLRLESLSLPQGVVEMEIEAEGVAATLEQVRMFEELLARMGQAKRRDLRAADRALARVRARWGDDAVVVTKLKEGHLPEARYFFAPLGKLKLPRPEMKTLPRRLIRRVFHKPEPLPPRPRQEPDGWMLRGLEHGPVVKVLGPFLVSGGWWRSGVQREYHFARTQKGAWLWVYYDRKRRRWFLQGVVG
jgi:protein ImuB